MKFRKLRIAFSIGCGLACLLICVMWIRSYWTFYACRDSIWHVQSARGVLVVFEVPQTDEWQTWSFPVDGVGPTEHLKYLMSGSLKTLSQRIASLSTTVSNVGPPLAVLPYWIVVLPLTALAAAPLVRWRFSLRMLLIATTLVAVVLGLIVWLNHH